MNRSLAKKATVLVALALVLAGILGSGSLVKVGAAVLRSDAGPTPAPETMSGVAEVKVTPLEGETPGFLVKWKTATPVKGWIEYGVDPDRLDRVGYDVRGMDVADTVHQVLVTGVPSESECYFVIVSNGQRHDNNGARFQIQVPASEQRRTTEESALQSESVAVQPFGPTPVPDAILDLQVSPADDGTRAFVVKWKTATPVKGWLEYGRNADHMDQVAYDVRGQEAIDTIHWVRVENVAPGTEYSFAIVSDDKRYSEAGYRVQAPVQEESREGAKPALATDASTPVKAGPTPAPDAILDMKVTPSERDGMSGFTVKWKTAIPVKGWLEYGSNAGDLGAIAYDTRGRDTIDTIHEIAVEGPALAPETFFVIVSDGRKYQEQDQPFRVMLQPMNGKGTEQRSDADDRSGESVIEPSVVCSIPIGESGIHYEGIGVPEMLAWGPSAFTVAPDGSYWIADTAANRILQYDSTCNLSAVIALDDSIVGINDLEVTDGSLWVLDSSAITPTLVQLAMDGRNLTRLEISPSMQPGLSGIALSEQGEVLIEQYGGASLWRITHDKDGSHFALQDGYLHHGMRYAASLGNLDATDAKKGTVSVGNDQIEVVTSSDLRGLRILGVAPDRSFYVIADEVAVGDTIRVDRTVHHYGADGSPLGVARVPLDRERVHVANGLAMGPNGTIYMLATREDHAEIQRLEFGSRLPPILSASTNARTTSQDVQPQSPQCIQRQTIIDNARAYLNNSKYLSTVNIDDGLQSCSGRTKPRYLNAGAGNYPSVPYDWGGFDSVNGYNGFMDPNTYQAGDIWWCDNGCVEACSKGVDCSGYVSRAWGLATKYSTGSLTGISTPLSSFGALQRGDILDLPASHVALFSSFAPNGGVNVYEATTDNLDRVVYRTWDLAKAANYTPFRYNDICVPDTCSGQFRAEYYNGSSPGGSPVFTQCENSSINYDWGTGGPGGGVGNDNFSVRWSGRFTFAGGSYTFSARVDDGIRVWLDDVMILDKWFDQGPTPYSVTRDVSAGEHSIQVDYYENGGGAVVQFSRSQGGGCLAESPHPYTNNYNNTWTLTNPDGNATASRIHFSRIETEPNYDYVYVRDASNNQINRWDGNHASGEWSATVPGRTVKVQLTSDGSVTAWGFCVDRIETVSGGTAPAAPSNLRATAVDSSRIQLDWNDNSNNETGFKIYDGDTYITTIGANVTSFTATGLAANSYHCYHIFAFNDYGNSPWTDWACATTPSGGCGGLIESPHPYTNNYNNTWSYTNPDTNATASRIHFSRIETEPNYDYVYVRDASNNQINRWDGTHASGEWSSTVPGRTVKVQLTSDGSVTAWGFCVDRIETVSGGTAPAAPSNLRATAVDSSRIQLDWNDNSNNETGFKIYDGDTYITTIGANVTSFTATGLAANSYHCYHIFAFNDYGNSPWTDWACATTPSGGCGGLIESPHPYTNNYNNTWSYTNPDTNATASRIHFSRIETEPNYDYVYVRDASNNQINRWDGTHASGEWSSTVPGRTVKVQLTSDGSVTAWGFCVDRIETVSGGTAPAAPSNLRATAVDSSRIQLDWNDNSNNETGFKIYDGDTYITTIGANVTSFTATGLAANSYHCYHIFAFNDYGNSPWTDWACATTPSGGCPNQYRAEYYNNRYLQGSPTFVQCEPWPIDHNWGTGGPGNGVGNDNFSVRWAGRAHISSGAYRFIARSDDGIRAWVGSTKVIDDWSDHGARDVITTGTVSDGDYDITVEYYENGGDAEAHFRWESQGACSGISIPLNQTVNGTIGSAGQQVNYCLSVSGGQWISLRMIGNPGWQTNKGDPILDVYNPSGALIGSGDDTFVVGSSNVYYRDAFLSVWLPSAGVYRIVAHMYGSNTAPYAMRLESGREAAPGDLNRDCAVNDSDSSILASRIGSSDPDADLLLDGIVNSVDMAILQANRGRGCTAAAGTLIEDKKSEKDRPSK